MGLRRRFASLSGARSLAYLVGMSRALRSGRLALHQLNAFVGSLPAGTMSEMEGRCERIAALAPSKGGSPGQMSLNPESGRVNVVRMAD